MQINLKKVFIFFIYSNILLFCNLNPIFAEDLKLIFSQKLPEQNEFIVGWNLSHDQNYSKSDKPQIGAEIKILRFLPPGRYLIIAKGTVTNINGLLAEAHVFTTQDSDILLGKIKGSDIESRNLVWRPMVNDEVIPVHKQIKKTLVISPLIKLNSNDLFIRQGDEETSLKLSESGQKLLKEKFEQFRNHKGRLLVEGYNLKAGNRETLRLESLMRAQTVATFLIREYSLATTEILPIGYGSDWKEAGMHSVSNDYSKNDETGIRLKLLSQ